MEDQVCPRCLRIAESPELKRHPMSRVSGWASHAFLKQPGNSRYNLRERRDTDLLNKFI